MNTSAIKKDGFLKLLKPKEVELYLNKYEEDQHFDIEITLPEEKMSDRQRKYYFAGIIKTASEHFRVDRNILHAFFKNLFLMELQDINGEVFPTFPKNKKFKKLRVKAMVIYIDNVRAELRNPDNLWKESFDTEDSDEFWARRNDGILL